MIDKTPISLKQPFEHLFNHPLFRLPDELGTNDTDKSSFGHVDSHINRQVPFGNQHFNEIIIT
jgi:hypothetical protein